MNTFVRTCNFLYSLLAAARPISIATFSMLGMLFLSAESWGQAVGDIRSAASGNWNAPATWERWDGSSWIAASTYPFPVVAGTQSSQHATAVTSHSVALPAGIVSGDLLLIFWADEDNVSNITTTGWTQLYENVVGNRRRSAYYRIADGTEGTTATFTTTAAETSAHNSYRISTGTYQGIPIVGTVATGNNAIPDPPSLTSGFGAINTLWIAASHSAGDDNVPTPTAPASYTNLITGYSGNSANDHARVATARRELSSATENPGTFGLGSNVQWAANTVAIQSITPSSASGAITIRNGHTVTVTAAANADECIIETGGQVTVNSGQTWTIANGTGTDLTVDGTVVNSGTMTMTGTATFNSGSTYQHAQNDGTIPTATWDANSNCNITGMTSTYPNGMGQTFGNVTFSSAIGDIEMSSSLTCAGNLTMSNTGAGALRLTDGATSRTITVGGNFTHTTGEFRHSNSTGSGNITVTGNFIKSGAGLYLIASGSGNSSLTVNGNVTISAGTFEMSDNTGIGTLNVAGNFSHTAGTITETAGGSGAIVFNGSGTQTYTSGGTVSNTINFTVNSGAFLQMATAGTTVTGGGTFTLSSGATLGITSAVGITSSGATGNIQVTGTRTFSTGANYIYNGAAAQNTGNGLPATVNNLTFNNTIGAVTFNSARTINGVFSITTGSVANLGTGLLHTAANLLFAGASQINGEWGHPTSLAANQNSTFFASSTGKINVSGTTTFTSSGTFTVPDGVTSITVQAWGGGGGGGSNNDAEGGGGGGAYATRVITVTEGQTFPVTVGTGGTEGNSGGSSQFGTTDPALVIAVGGSSGSGNTGFAGGQASACTPVAGAFSGGSGGNAAPSQGGGDNEGGGGGGGSAFTNANGNPGGNGTNSTTAGGTGGTGTGNGGNGAAADSSPGAQNGSAPGGGGGGVGEDGGTSGSGASGQVIISWIVTPPCTDPNVPTVSFTETSGTTNNDGTICNGASVTLSIATGNLNDATNWQWYTGSCGGTSAGSGTSIIVSPTATTTYYVRGEGGCVTPGSCAQVTVTVNTPPTCNITGANAVCAGSLANAYSAPGGMSNYNWGISGNGTFAGGAPGNVQNVSVDAGVSGSFTVSVTITDANGCVSSCSKIVTVNANPTASISGALTFCAGGSTTLTASGGTSYLWDDASTNAMRTITAGGTYTVQVTDGNGCTDTETATVTVNPLPTASITGTLSFCTGDNTVLTASGGTSYLWDDASTNDTRIISVAGTYTVQVTDGNGCTDTETATVTESTPATADAGGPYSTCGTTPVNISATTNGTGTWSGGLGSFANATSANTTYTPAMSELGTTVMLTWTTDDPDGPDACTAVSDMASLSVAGQEINVKGNGVSIPDGSAAPNTADYTDFGWTTVAAGMITRTFSIENTGTSNLTLTGGMPVTIGGPHAGDFTVLMQPGSPVGLGGMAQFQIQFDPSAAGARNATVSIASNDCDENPYTFNIMGKGTIPQAISVFGNGNQIANRASTVSLSDHTDFGSASTGGGMVSRTYTINNVANGSPLSLTGVPRVTIADRDAADFTVTIQPASPIDGGSSTTFTIKFQPSATGLRTAIVIITHDDLPENPFVFTVNGTGL